MDGYDSSLKTPNPFAGEGLLNHETSSGGAAQGVGVDGIVDAETIRNAISSLQENHKLLETAGAPQQQLNLLNGNIQALKKEVRVFLALAKMRGADIHDSGAWSRIIAPDFLRFHASPFSF